jgi:transcription-repair coupling factor (superfamily II helicase)
MYRRLAVCDNLDVIVQVVNDLATGYGELPESAKRLVKYHELRVAASHLGISSITIDESDVVFRIKDAKYLEDHFQNADGTLRRVSVPSSSGLTVVYYRPSNAKDSNALLCNLHAHLVESS